MSDFLRAARFAAIAAGHGQNSGAPT